MTITLFQRTNLRGDNSRITRDENDLDDLSVDRNPGSMTMTAVGDAMLLFKRPDWRGGVLYRRRRNTINNLGSRAQGGRSSFGSCASIRVTPFHINLNVTVVTQSDGTLPGTYTSLTRLERDLNQAVVRINRFYGREQALLTVNIAHHNQRTHDNKFNLSVAEASRFPAAWKNRREIDLVVVNSFDGGFTGMAKPPWWGKTIIVAMRTGGSTGPQRNLSAVAKTIAHEIGHFLGSPHVTGGNNVMRQGEFDIATRTATADQIEEWHTKLSRNLTRRRNRAEA